MSWNLYIGKSEKCKSWPYQQFKSELNRSFNGLVWNGDEQCSLNVDRGFILDIKIKNDEIESIFTNGGYGHLKIFSKLAKAYQLEIFDPQEGVDLDLDDPYSIY